MFETPFYLVSLLACIVLYPSCKTVFIKLPDRIRALATADDLRACPKTGPVLHLSFCLSLNALERAK